MAACWGAGASARAATLASGRWIEAGATAGLATVAGVMVRRAVNAGARVGFVDCVEHRAGTDREIARSDRAAMVEILSQDGAVLVAGPGAGDLSDLVKETGCKVLPLRAGANAAGLDALGLQAVDMATMANGAATLLLGEVPEGLIRPKGFFAAQTVTAAEKVEAELVLARTHYLDDQGTVLSTDGRVCELTPKRERPANWHLLRDLAVAVGAEMDLDGVLAEARALIG